MAYNPNFHKRRSIRLAGRDYSRAGAYFVTVVTGRKAHRLGEVRGGRMILNGNGRIVAEEWRALGRRFAAVWLDAWVVMPNHIHGIVWILAPGPRGAWRGAPAHSEYAGDVQAKPKPLGQIIGAFKTAVSRRINERDGTAGQSIWQRNYYERVVRNQAELERIRRYIWKNPARWASNHEPR